MLASFGKPTTVVTVRARRPGDWNIHGTSLGATKTTLGPRGRVIPRDTPAILRGFGDITPNEIDPFTGWAVDPATGFPIDPSTGNPTSPSLLRASVSTISLPVPTTGETVDVPVITTTNEATGVTTSVALVTDANTNTTTTVPVPTVKPSLLSRMPKWAPWAAIGAAALLLIRR